jgi:hypothetical protein
VGDIFSVDGGASQAGGAVGLAVLSKNVFDAD